MTDELKQMAYDYIVKHNDGSEETNKLIIYLKDELSFHDIPNCYLSLNDFDCFKKEVNQFLGKNENEELTEKDIQKLSLHLEDSMSNELDKQLELILNIE